MGALDDSGKEGVRTVIGIIGADGGDGRGNFIGENSYEDGGEKGLKVSDGGWYT